MRHVQINLAGGNRIELAVIDAELVVALDGGWISIRPDFSISARKIGHREAGVLVAHCCADH